MPPETYQILKDTSLARIEREWALSDSQRCVMRAMVLLSYAEGQSWALIPCQQKLATALRVHKATVSRAIRSCIALGILERLERQHETLYRVMPNAAGVPACGNDASEKAMAELVELQRMRLQGSAEASGQIRLPGILPSEETDAPAEALEAAMTHVECRMSNEGSGAAKEESDAEFHARLEALARQGGVVQTIAVPQARSADALPPVRGSEMTWVNALGNLNDNQRRLMTLLRDECRATNAQSERDVIQYAYRWRNEMRKRPARLIEELIATHKYFRLSGRPWESVGKYMDCQLKKIDEQAEMAKTMDSS